MQPEQIKILFPPGSRAWEYTDGGPGWRCRVTGVDRDDRLQHLRASHTKPWRDSDNRERLDGEYGLLLTPSVDHLNESPFGSPAALPPRSLALARDDEGRVGSLG